MKKYALVAVICAGFLAGCASQMDRSFEPMDWTDWWSSSCKSKDTTAGCFIVVDAWELGDGTCAAAVVKSQESVGFRKDARDKKIEWRFTEKAEDDGFRFLPNGIEPKSTPAGNDANWKENFEADAVGGGKKFKLKNKNKESQTKEIEYFYMVRVQLERQGMPPLICKPQDPVIRNQR